MIFPQQDHIVVLIVAVRVRIFLHYFSLTISRVHYETIGRSSLTHLIVWILRIRQVKGRSRHTTFLAVTFCLGLIRHTITLISNLCFLVQILCVNRQRQI